MEFTINTLSGDEPIIIKTEKKEFFDHEIRLLFKKELNIPLKYYYIIWKDELDDSSKIIYANFYEVYFDNKIIISNNLNIIYPSFNNKYGTCLLKKLRQYRYINCSINQDLENELHESGLLNIESFIFSTIQYNIGIYQLIPKELINNKLFMIKLLNYRKDVLSMMDTDNHILLNDINFLIIIINKYKLKYSFLSMELKLSLINKKIILLNILKYDSNIYLYNYLLKNIYDNNYNELLIDIANILEINNLSDYTIFTTPIILKLNQLCPYSYKKLYYNHPLIKYLCSFYMKMDIKQLQTNKISFNIKGTYLIFINSREEKNNKDLVEYAVSCNGLELKYASLDFRKDEELVLIAVKENGLALKYALNNLNNDFTIAIAAYNQNSKSLVYTTRRIRQMIKDKEHKK